MDIKFFMFGGKAIFTIANPNTGTRFTYKIHAKEIDETRTLHFVSVLTGPDNTADYTYLGTIFDAQTYRHGRKSRIGEDAPSAKAFAWFFRRVASGRDFAPAEVNHEGRCCRCGRLLTVPESVSSGIGPECAKQISVSAQAEMFN